ncbi:hypothetical protein RNAN_1211 [Rheinheimera nanhaiensis E407-8]|uniref:Uncharacterized protein n=1 Tax=Rheinheimera nanhaiensis E407-8 TaxID=562729 RepID=I1DW12_9GAMM|nr:hypothetical protein RNAN_1211 [Rheinheimera nanhaiensis E407-8]
MAIDSARQAKTVITNAEQYSQAVLSASDNTAQEISTGYGVGLAIKSGNFTF